MSYATIGPDGNITCPNCYGIMLELHRFDARDDIFGLDYDSHLHRRGFGYEGSLIAELVQSIFAWIGAHLRQWRLRRVLRRWPLSLYCPACGYLIKRGRKPGRV